MKTEELTPTAINVAAAAAGAVASGFIRKKVTFLDSTVGKLVIAALGIFLVISQKSNVLKGVGTGVAINGVLGLCDKFLGQTQGVFGVGEIVQGPDGLTYIVNGVGELEAYTPAELEQGQYEIVEGIGEDEDYLSGVDGDADFGA